MTLVEAKDEAGLGGFLCHFGDLGGADSDDGLSSRIFFFSVRVAVT